MPNIIRDFSKETFYHIYNRGFNKQVIFHSKRDFERFEEKMETYLKKFPSLEIEAYCLLPNHFHFIIKDQFLKNDPSKQNEKTDLISNFMKKIQLSHAMYITTKYQKKTQKHGPFFEGRFRAKSLDSDAYREHILNYVELNALKHKLVDNPQLWPYSSFKKRNNKLDCDEKIFLLDDLNLEGD